MNHLISAAFFAVITDAGRLAPVLVSVTVNLGELHVIAVRSGVVPHPAKILSEFLELHVIQHFTALAVTDFAARNAVVPRELAVSLDISSLVAHDRADEEAEALAVFLVLATDLTVESEPVAQAVKRGRGVLVGNPSHLFGNAVGASAVDYQLFSHAENARGSAVSDKLFSLVSMQLAYPLVFGAAELFRTVKVFVAAVDIPFAEIVLSKDLRRLGDFSGRLIEELYSASGIPLDSRTLEQTVTKLVLSLGRTRICAADNLGNFPEALRAEFLLSLFAAVSRLLKQDSYALYRIPSAVIGAAPDFRDIEDTCFAVVGLRTLKELKRIVVIALLQAVESLVKSRLWNTQLGTVAENGFIIVLAENALSKSARDLSAAKTLTAILKISAEGILGDTSISE